VEKPFASSTSTVATTTGRVIRQFENQKRITKYPHQRTLQGRNSTLTQTRYFTWIHKNPTTVSMHHRVEARATPTTKPKTIQTAVSTDSLNVSINNTFQDTPKVRNGSRIHRLSSDHTGNKTGKNVRKPRILRVRPGYKRHRKRKQQHRQVYRIGPVGESTITQIKPTPGDYAQPAPTPKRSHTRTRVSSGPRGNGRTTSRQAEVTNISDANRTTYEEIHVTTTTTVTMTQESNDQHKTTELTLEKPNTFGNVKGMEITRGQERTTEKAKLVSTPITSKSIGYHLQRTSQTEMSRDILETVVSLNSTNQRQQSTPALFPQDHRVDGSTISSKSDKIQLKDTTSSTWIDTDYDASLWPSPDEDYDYIFPFDDFYNTSWNMKPNSDLPQPVHGKKTSTSSLSFGRSTSSNVSLYLSFDYNI